MRARNLFLMTAVLGFFAAPALARDIDDDTQEAVVPGEGERAKPERVGPKMLSLQLGIGVSDFNGEMSDNLSPGPSWDLRGAFGNTQRIGGELAYMGTAQSLEGQDPDTGLDLSGTALTSVGEGSVRFNALTDKMLQPFATLGLGMLSMDVRDEDTTIDRGTALAVPVGAGVQVYTDEALTFGGRVNYRILTDVINNDLPSGDNWNVAVNVGATF